MKARIISSHQIVELYTTIHNGQELLTDGDLFYSKSEIQILEPDWDSFRREAAIRAMQSILSRGIGVPNDVAYTAVIYADALIKELKEK